MVPKIELRKEREMSDDDKNKYYIGNLIENHKGSSDGPKKRKRFSDYNRKEQIVFVAVYIIAMIIELEIYNSFKTISDFLVQEGSTNPLHIFFMAIRENPIMLIIMLLIAYLIASSIAGRAGKKKVPKMDERGELVLDESNSAGSSRFMSDDEKRKIFEYLDPSEPEGNIIGVDKKTGELITTPWKNSKFSNRNIALIGPPGTRKTSGILLPNLFSNIQAGNSVVCTDPKGELYRETYAAAKYNKYNIRVFNILGTQFAHSDGWDCLKPIREAKTLAEAQTQAQIFSNVFLSNTGGDQHKEFWWDASLNCLTMTILYVAKSHHFVPNAMRENMSDEDDEESTDQNFNSQRTLKEVYELIASDDLANIISQAIETDREDAEILKKSFNIWHDHKEASSIKASLGNTLNLISTPEVSNILSTDEIDFSELADKKTIIYVVCDDSDNTYTALLTLFVTFMFSEIKKTADSKPGGSLERPLSVILEEAGNIGTISNLPRYIATLRSRNIGIMLCFQNIGQIMSKYGMNNNGKYDWETILGGCSIQLCLGSNDERTNEYFSKRSGTMSIVTEREAERRNKYIPDSIQKYTVMEKNNMTSTTSRPTLYPDEVQHIKVDEILISPAMDNVTIENKYYYKLHPLYNIKLIDTRTGKEVDHFTNDHIPDWNKKGNEEGKHLKAVRIDNDFKPIISSREKHRKRFSDFLSKDE